ncbi:MAG: efflux RND transporter periplasmic adaptor subunit [Gemmataceae bacterium]
MKTKVDLSQLAVTRDAPKALPVPPSAAARRNLLTRFVLPGLLLAGFAAVMVYAARETLSPPRSITVIPVTTSQTAMDAPSDTPLFRAAGWVEPKPTPTIVTALAEGVVEQLLVVEGQEVRQGQTVARLMAADAKIALESAEAEVDLRESELASAMSALAGAKARHELPVHLQAELADAETALAKAESDLEMVPNALAAAAARHEFAKRDYEGQKRAIGAVSAISMSKAQSDMNAAGGSLRELQTRQKRLPVEIAALKAKREAQRQKLERKVDEFRQLGEAEAAVKAAQAKVRQAKAAREAARLRLDRMEVKAPAAGKVLGLVARPGTRLNGLAVGSLQDSSTVVTLYNPASLQVRVDVRLDDVGKVRPGQKVRIETAALPDARLEGEVLLATSQADIQKNTLSVKVAIHDPPSTLKPEMLCQVTFLSPPRPATTASRGSERYRMLVPRQLIDSTAGAASLWVVDQLTCAARLRTVELGLSAGDLIEVVTGLAPQDKLIVAGREGLRDGARVRVVGEDESMGIAAPAGRKK